MNILSKNKNDFSHYCPQFEALYYLCNNILDKYAPFDQTMGFIHNGHY